MYWRLNAEEIETPNSTTFMDNEFRTTRKGSFPSFGSRFGTANYTPSLYCIPDNSSGRRPVEGFRPSMLVQGKLRELVSQTLSSAVRSMQWATFVVGQNILETVYCTGWNWQWQTALACTKLPCFWFITANFTRHRGSCGIQHRFATTGTACGLEEISVLSTWFTTRFFPSQPLKVTFRGIGLPKSLTQAVN